MTRSVAYQYNDNGQVIAIDGARTDVNDTTVITYYDCGNAEDINACGQIKSITNALGEVTKFSDYQAGGLVGKITQPNGLVTTYRYDALERIISITEQDAGIYHIYTISGLIIIDMSRIYAL